MLYALWRQQNDVNAQHQVDSVGASFRNQFKNHKIISSWSTFKWCQKSSNRIASEHKKQVKWMFSANSPDCLVSGLDKKKTGSYQSISATYDQSQGLSVRELSDNLIPLYWHRLTTPETFIQTCMSHWLVSSGTVFLKAGHNEKVSKSKIWLDRFLRNARINLTNTNLIFLGSSWDFH